MNLKSLTTEEKQEAKIKTLRDELRGLAKDHKELDNKLSKEFPNLFINEINGFKKKLSEIRRVMNRKIKQLSSLGVTWENEIERMSIDKAA